MLSYCEFQFPLEPSVGSHWGKQSNASSNVRLRTITLFALLSRTWAPTIVASAPRPTMVVFDGTLIRIRRCWLAWDARRAVSSGPLGAFRPHVAGS
jgi:hypothetical protein